MQGISIKAVVLATLAVFGIDFVSANLLAHSFDLPLDGTQEELRAAVDALNQNSRYMLAALALGSASTAVGGYLTAFLARTLPYFNALAFAVLGIAIGIPMTTGVPMGWRFIGLLATIPAALLGARIYKQHVGS
jgi:hypothetical protein